MSPSRERRQDAQRALSAGARWAGKQWAKYRDGKKFFDEHGDTPETREALAKANGDAKKAREHLKAKRQQDRRERDEEEQRCDTLARAALRNARNRSDIAVSSHRP